MEYYKFLREHVGHQPIMLVGAGVIIYKDDMILLQRRKDDKCWGKHGGIVEIWENTVDTVRRELREEINVSVGELTLFGVYSGADYRVEYDNGDVVNYVDVVYTANQLLDEPSPDNVETLEVRWFHKDALPEDIHPTDRAPIMDLAKTL